MLPHGRVHPVASPTAYQAPAPLLTPIYLRNVNKNPLFPLLQAFPRVLKESVKSLLRTNPVEPTCAESSLQEAGKTGLMGEPSLA